MTKRRDNQGHLERDSQDLSFLADSPSRVQEMLEFWQQQLSAVPPQERDDFWKFVSQAIKRSYGEAVSELRNLRGGHQEDLVLTETAMLVGWCKDRRIVPIDSDHAGLTAQLAANPTFVRYVPAAVAFAHGIGESPLEHAGMGFDLAPKHCVGFALSTWAAFSNWRSLSAERSQLVEMAEAHAAALEHMRNGQAEVSHLKNVLETQLCLEAPAKYWNDKAWWHAFWTTVLAIAFAIGATGAVIWVVMSTRVLLDSTPQEQQLPPFWEMARFALISLLILWPLHLIVRMLVVMIHLRQDAKERWTMSQAFLALRERGGITERQLGIVLRALFRPASTGLSKETGAPPGVMQFIEGVRSKAN